MKIGQGHHWLKDSALTGGQHPEWIGNEFGRRKGEPVCSAHGLACLRGWHPLDTTEIKRNTTAAWGCPGTNLYTWTVHILGFVLRNKGNLQWWNKQSQRGNFTDWRQERLAGSRGGGTHLILFLRVADPVAQTTWHQRAWKSLSLVHELFFPVKGNKTQDSRLWGSTDSGDKGSICRLSVQASSYPARASESSGVYFIFMFLFFRKVKMA